jgi:Transglutaminase-like superfamily
LKRTRYALLVMRALWELTLYDLVNATLGFQRIHRQVAKQRVAAHTFHAETDAVVCEAVSLAACFYYKPVRCLQRSAVATRLLRKCGINGRLVIGYRPAPFFSHAWVEVDGRVVNDSPAYKDRLNVLCTF